MKVIPEQEDGIFAMRSEEDCEFEIFDNYQDARAKAQEYLESACKEEPEYLVYDDYAKGLAVWKLDTPCLMMPDDAGPMLLRFPYSNVGNLLREIESLKKQVAILKEACEFYGDKENWFGGGDNDYTYFQGIRLNENESISEDWEAFGTNSYGGKRARQALKEIRELRGE